jgi:hypothetical protein
MIQINIMTRLKLCWKILITRGYSDDYTIKELLEDDF